MRVPLEASAVEIFLRVYHEEIIVVHHVLHVLPVIVVPAIHAPIVMVISVLLLVLVVHLRLIVGMADESCLNCAL